ncbi:NADP-dependent oxidoreductase [Myxococcus llanfairpwllgwyngyllgogerychwyrndrobwllllantysiliogogogochensis]|uniref:NADP-dependent oxidoreductase n=1 Tax=Myxococcus llanfairpwllgwyngyllgogerychwyrndrobwllllantysiliogogogochensis TaxID=2590453 RepID=A0A540X078_9BACT|nr:NADP-dependent oxidoreductase [Myxococcus llanfairpwllgwyngyllgogerychwyrndrobwllllantysiliogogogochensis]TQF14600.1 NADP-dependent oxidoreductase [Myxococcus llanfairpwllgwyngyllgogerychwyrndrobwllllantysiliogogogochensis]
MKAVVLKAYGDVDNLVVSEMPEPKVGPGDVKVRVTAASINPVDWKIRRGDMREYMPLTLPTILGRDVSGEVIEVGQGVEGFKRGDRVMGLVSAGYAQTVVAPSDVWAKVPDSLELKDAAALPLVTLTGVQLIEEQMKPVQGDTVLITGALGAVGRAALFAAKARGVKVWAGVRARQVEEARKLGADGVVALDDPKDVAKLPTLDAVADTVGGEAVAAVLDKVKRGGLVGSVVGEPKGARDKGLQVVTFFSHPDGRRLAQLGESVAKGELRIPIGKTFPMDAAKDAQKHAEKGGAGKVLLVN